MSILSYYPPVLETTSVQAVTIGSNIKIKYQDFVGNEELSWVQASFRRADNNEIINYIYSTEVKEKDENNNDITIIIDSLQEKDGEFEIVIGENCFPKGVMIKGQIRFCNVDLSATSEWSSIFIFKAIEGNYVSTIAEPTGGLLPRLVAYLDEGSRSALLADGETLEDYRFTVQVGEYIIEDSSWLQHQGDESSQDVYQTKTSLTNTGEYDIYHWIRTKNGYVCLGHTLSKYKSLEESDNIVEAMQLKVTSDLEEGTIVIDINKKEGSDQEVGGKVYLISRTSSANEFKTWESLHYFSLDADETSYNFIDYTIEDGMIYQYCIQRIKDAAGVRSGRVFSDKILGRLAYAYLWNGRAQLKLKFNNKLSSFKYTIPTSKIETIGGKYPTIYRNGYVKYAEFPISALISLHLDDNHSFFQYDQDTGYYYNDELIIPVEKLNGEDFNINLTYDNIYIERKFREKVEEFLNDGTEKLYRSPTEGNFLVYLMNVSFSPEQKLGRMISNVSAQAYEIGSCDLTNLSTIGFLTGELTKEVTIATSTVDISEEVNGMYSISDAIIESGKTEVKENIQEITLISYTAKSDSVIKETITGNEILVRAGVTYNPNLTTKGDIQIIQGTGTITFTAEVLVDVYAEVPDETIYKLVNIVNQFINVSAPMNVVEKIIQEENITTNKTYRLNRLVIQTTGNDSITEFVFNGNTIYLNDDITEYTIVNIENPQLDSIKLVSGIVTIYYEITGYQVANEEGESV